MAVGVKEILESSARHPVPERIKIDEQLVTKYSKSGGKIAVLIEELLRNPLLAFGKMGPSAYKEPPSRLKSEKFEGLDVYGWGKGSPRRECKQSYALVVGAVSKQGKEYVYFVLTKDITSNIDSYIRIHAVVEKNVYKTSHQTFYNYLLDLYAPVGVKSYLPKDLAPFSGPREEFIQQLITSGTLDEILGAKEETFKQIGQAIFDHYKSSLQSIGLQPNSYGAKEELSSILEELALRSDDGRMRVQFIERAWDGVGDGTCMWRA